MNLCIKYAFIIVFILPFCPLLMKDRVWTVSQGKCSTLCLWSEYSAMHIVHIIGWSCQLKTTHGSGKLPAWTFSQKLGSQHQPGRKNEINSVYYSLVSPYGQIVTWERTVLLGKVVDPALYGCGFCFVGWELDSVATLVLFLLQRSWPGARPREAQAQLNPSASFQWSGWKQQVMARGMFYPVILKNCGDWVSDWLCSIGFMAWSLEKRLTSSWVWLREATSSGRASGSREHTLWL